MHKKIISEQLRLLSKKVWPSLFSKAYNYVLCDLRTYGSPGSKYFVFAMNNNSEESHSTFKCATGLDNSSYLKLTISKFNPFERMVTRIIGPSLNM